MERWRWMPEDLGNEHIMVNIAGFDLKLVRDGETEDRMAVVVGKPYSRTPAFSDAIRYVELNPYWNVPTGIAIKEELPKLRQNPAARATAGFEAVQGNRVYPLTAINWSQYGRAIFHFSFVSVPEEQCSRKSQVHVPEQVQCLSARHACKELVRTQRAGVQSWLHSAVAADRLGGGSSARRRDGPAAASMRS